MHKMAIVGAFQARRAVVAMIGDGGECLPFLFNFMDLMLPGLSSFPVQDKPEQHRAQWDALHP